MSKIQHPNDETKKLQETPSIPSAVELTNSAPAVDQEKELHTTRVVFEANATAQQMQDGVIVQLADAFTLHPKKSM